MKYPVNPKAPQVEEKTPFKRRVSLWWDLDGGKEFVLGAFVFSFIPLSVILFYLLLLCL